MELHQVRYFLAVAETLNFTRAAESCNVAQPSLTRAIKLLEEELGGSLFHRERQNTHLTELGRMVEPHLRKVHEETATARALARDFKAIRKTRLKLGIMCTIAPTQFVELIGSVRSRYPEVELEIVDANAMELSRKLLAGELEVAIYCLPEESEEQRFHRMPLFSEQMMIVVNPEHPLARQNAVRLRDLEGLDYLCRINCEFNKVVDDVFDAQGVDCNTVYHSERDDWILAMIASGMGFGFMAQFSAIYPTVVARPMIDPEFHRRVSLTTVRGRPYSPAVGAFVREAMRVNWLGKPALAVSEARGAA